MPTDTETEQKQDPFDAFLAKRKGKAAPASDDSQGEVDPFDAFIAKRTATKATEAEKKAAKLQKEITAPPPATPGAGLKLPLVKPNTVGKAVPPLEAISKAIFGGAEPTEATKEARGGAVPPPESAGPLSTLNLPEVMGGYQAGTVGGPFNESLSERADKPPLEPLIPPSGGSQRNATFSRFPEPKNAVDLARADQLLNVASEMSGSKNTSVQADAEALPYWAAHIRNKQTLAEMGKDIPTEEEKQARKDKETIARRAALAKQAAGIDPTEAGTRAKYGVPIEPDVTAGQKFAQDVSTGSKKFPLIAFTEPGPTNPLPAGIRLSNVGELSDLTDEFLSRPDIPKTRKEAFAAGMTADAVRTLNDMFLSPVGIAATGTGLVAANALSRAGRAGKIALDLADEYQAMSKAGATPAELLIQEGKIRQAMEVATKARSVVKTAAGAARAGGAAFGANGANGFIDGIKEKDTSKILSGLGQMVIAGAGELGLHQAGGMEAAVRGATAAEAAKQYREAGDRVTGATRTQQVPETPAVPPEPGALPAPSEPTAEDLEAELQHAHAHATADTMEKAAEELRKEAGGAPQKPGQPKVPFKKPKKPAATEELGAADRAGKKPQETAPAPAGAIEGPTGATPAENVPRETIKPKAEETKPTESAGGEAPGLIIPPESTRSSAAPTPPPGPRWTPDRGAMPGEPELFLDVPKDGDTDKAKAAIIQRDDPRHPGRATWELVHGVDDKATSAGMFSTPDEAAKFAEKKFPAEPVERRKNVAQRQRLAEMTPEEMRSELLTSKITGLPNRRAFDEHEHPAPAVAMSDADGLKAINDRFGYNAGNDFLKAKADALREAGLDAYHEKGDEFLYRGNSGEELQKKLERAREILRNKIIDVTRIDGSVQAFRGADFSYGHGKNLAEAETALKAHKTEREARGERARGELRGITKVGPEDRQVDKDTEVGGGVLSKSEKAALEADRGARKVPFVRKEVAESERGHATKEAETPPSKSSVAKQFNEGDHVQYVNSKGEKLTGKVRSIDAGRGEAFVDVDQQAIMRIPGRKGGVPIGRVEIVPLKDLQVADIWKGPTKEAQSGPLTEGHNLGKPGVIDVGPERLAAPEKAAIEDISMTDLGGGNTVYKGTVDGEKTSFVGSSTLTRTQVERELLASKRETKIEQTGRPGEAKFKGKIGDVKPAIDVAPEPSKKVPFAKPTAKQEEAGLTQTGAPATVQEEGEHGVQTTDRGRLEPDTGGAEPGGLGEAPPAGEQSGAVQGATEERPARGAREGGGEAGEVSGGEPGGAGAESTGGVGVRVEPGDVSETGTRKPATRGVKPSSSVDGNFYHITPEDHLGEGGLKTKFRQNIAAVKLLQKLQAENNRLATPDEQAVLVKYVGWGGLQAPFKYYPDKEWEKEAKELKELLTKEEFEAASGSTQFAHYTSPEVIHEMWSALERIGFSGGRVLEPAAGVGHFMGGAPLEIASNSRFAAVEIDPLSAQIARQLYQPVKVFNAPFQKVPFPNGFFDLAITNVPFSDTKPADPKYDKYGLNLHNYFIVRSLDLLRPGGVLAVITTRTTMDSTKYERHRQMMSDRADLLTAVRLPDTAFKKNADTEVVADLLIFRKRLPEQSPGGHPFVETEGVKLNPSGAVQVVDRSQTRPDFNLNKFFLDHPEKVLGKHSTQGTMYRADDYTVKPNTETPLYEQLNTALQIAHDQYQSQAVSSPEAEAGAITAERQAELKSKPFAYHIQDDKLYQNLPQNLMSTVAGELVPTPRAEWSFALKPVEVGLPELRRIKGLFGVRDAARAIMLAEFDDKPADDLKTLRKELNKVYNKHVATYGAINGKRNSTLIVDDPDFPLLQSLENYDADTGQFNKSDIFTKPTVRPHGVAKIETPVDAMLMSMRDRNSVDVPFMAKALGQTEDFVVNDLVSKNLIYKNPEGGWEQSEAYLSGNVRAKLHAAEAAAQVDPTYARNIEPLKAVQPRLKEPEDISVKLGTPWIPTEDIGQFLKEVLDERHAKVSHVPNSGEWGIDHKSMGPSFKNVTELGTQDFWASDLIDLALNQKEPVVRVKDAEGKSVLVHDRTELARNKQQELQEAFKTWLWSDPARKDRLMSHYNENINNIAPRKFDGSHLDPPGLAMGVTLRPHQKDAVWRATQSPNTLFAHEVGTGKMLIFISTALEAKRMALWQKPTIVVHNATIEQYRQAIPMYYPQAKVLIPTEEDFSQDNRRKLLARIATGDWDAVVITHSQLIKLPVSEQALTDFTNKELSTLREYLQTMEEEEGASRGRQGKKKSLRVKQIEKMLDKVEARMEKMVKDYKKDPSVTFEETGIDALLVDEADEFKNLMYISKMDRVKGLGNQEGSQRAFDLLVKASIVRAMNNGGGIVFGTGTPVSNTMAEIYTLMRYLAPEKLEQLGISQFDAWAAQFGKVRTDWEASPIDPTKIQRVQRFARLQNGQELFNHNAEFTDVVFTKDIPGIKLPKNNIHKKVLGSYPALDDYSKALVERGEKIKGGSVDPEDDNMLVVTTDGGKASIDLRFVDPSGEDNPLSKLNQVALDVHNEWKNSHAKKGVQLICLDIGVPGKSKAKVTFKGYEAIKDKLVSLGIPKEQIAFVQKFDTPELKQKMNQDVNAGVIRVLIGSTAKMGVGLNVQQRLIGGHHVDIGWRPRDATQREGRWIRQGNSNSEVFTKYWTTERTLDSYKYSTLNAKRGFIDEYLRGELTNPDVEDISGEAVSFGVISAATTGRPEIVELAKTQAEMRRLSALEAGTEKKLRNTKLQLQDSKARLASAKEDIERLTQEADFIKKSYDPAKFQISVNGKDFTDRSEANTSLKAAEDKLAAKKYDGKVQIGEFLGRPINYVGILYKQKPFEGTYDRHISVRNRAIPGGSESPISSVVNEVTRGPQNELEDEIALRDKMQTEIPQLETLVKTTGFSAEKKKQLQDLQAKEHGLLKTLGLLDSDLQAEAATPTKAEEQPAEEEGWSDDPASKERVKQKFDLAYAEAERLAKEGLGANNTLFTKERKEAAEKRLRDKIIKEQRAGLDPTMLKDLAEIGGFYLEAGVRDFAEWSKKLIEHFKGTRAAGKLEPHLKDIFERAIQAGEKQKPGFAANIRLSNIDAADEVINVIRETARSQAGRIEEQRRGQVPFSKTRERAQQLVRDGQIREKDIANMKKGTALNDAELKAARSILVAISEDVAKALKEFKADDNPDTLLKVMEVVKRQRAVQAAVSGATAEAGRALNSMKIAAAALRSGANRDKAIAELGGELTEEMVRRLAQIDENDHVALNRFIRDHTTFSTKEKLNSYWIANVLSGWQTHAKVAISNAVWAATQVGIRPVRGLIDAPVSRLMGTERKYYAGETLPALVGWFEGWPEGLRKAAWIMQHGYSLDNSTGEMLTDVKAPRYYEFPGGLKNPFNYPGRMLMAAHNFFRVASLESELAAIAARKALRLGYSGARLRFGQERANPEVEDIEQARKFARYTAFLDAPDSFSRMLIRLREWQVPPDWNTVGGLKPFRFVVPFINLPWNITKAGMEVTPLGAVRFLSKEAREEPGKAADILAKALLGGAVLSVFAMVAMNGNLTGPAPKEPNKREEFYRLGKKPYSINIGGTWYPYLRWTGPFGIGIAPVAAWYDKFNNDGTTPSTERMMNAASAVGRAIFDQTFFLGLANVLDAIREGKSYGAKFAADLLSGFVPFSGLQRNVVQSTDVYRDARGVPDRLKAGIPGLSQTLPPQRDIFGRTTRQSLLGTENKDKVDKELARIGIQPGPLTDKIRLSKLEFDLSPKGTDVYHRMTGELLYKTLAKTMESEGYKSASDYNKSQIIEREVSAVRTAGKEIMLTKVKANPDFKASPFLKLRVPFAKKTQAAPPPQ